MSLANIMRGRLPGDVTVGEARNFMLEYVPELQHLRSLSRTARVAIRFCWMDEPASDVPDDMPLYKFRALADDGQARIIVSDGTGGVRVGELV